MSAFTEWMIRMGRYFPLVLIGCIEIVAAVLLLGVIPARRRRAARRGTDAPERARLFLKELVAQTDEVCLALRCSDLMPLGAVGALEGLLGVTLEKLQEDVECLLRAAEDSETSRLFWRDYRAWDGSGSLRRELAMQDDQWLSCEVHRDGEEGVDLLIFHRNTEEHRKEEEYLRHREEAEKASQFKFSFLFRMSHEIRTPMNGIIGLLKLAEDKLEPAHPAMQYLYRTDELSAHLLSLINDILDMSRIEAGKVELEPDCFSLHTFAGKLYDMFAKTLESKGVAYAVEYDGLTVDRVIGDELRIGQVIINFLSNAVKFTSQGEVRVTFRQMMCRDGMVDLMIRVHDTGIGMAPEFISRIFDPFEQEDASTTRRYGGTGLGMAISDQLVKLMGGQIVVESTKGVGSDFSVFLSLPVATAEQEETYQTQQTAAEQQPEPVPEKLNCRVLMAEDNEINALIAVEILSQRGVQVDVEENGKKAVERFRKEPAGTYTLILMDVQMPVMNGRTAARTIRGLKDRPDAATIPIYALSADAFVEDERLSRESGMNGHLTKPIDYDGLMRIIQKELQTKEMVQ